jgi:hypothetical protein
MPRQDRTHQVLAALRGGASEHSITAQADPAETGRVLRAASAGPEGQQCEFGHLHSAALMPGAFNFSISTAL